MWYTSRTERKTFVFCERLTRPEVLKLPRQQTSALKVEKEVESKQQERGALYASKVWMEVFLRTTEAPVPMTVEMHG